jgi:transposase
MENALEKALPRVYTEQHKLEAIKLAEQVGPNQACQRLGIPKGTLSYWLNAHRKNTWIAGETKAKPAPGSVVELQAELNRLRQENSHLKMDVEILKKAAAYFAKVSE